MNCEEVRSNWTLYHDSEGDAEQSWAVRRHLEECPECAERFARESRLEEAVVAKLRSVPLEEDEWDRVLGKVALAPTVASRRWLLFSALAACATAAAIALALLPTFVWQTESAHGDSLSALSAAWHERLSTGSERAEFLSESDVAVEDYLRAEVPFPVRCPPRSDSGFAVLGAGTCRLADQATAYVVGEVDDAPVSVFILARDSLDAFPHQREALRREAIHRCREGDNEMALAVVDRNLVLVVGRAPQDRLVRVLRAYGTYPHAS